MALQWDRFSNGAQMAAKFAGAAHTAYQVGKAVYGLGVAVAPYAALLL